MKWLPKLLALPSDVTDEQAMEDVQSRAHHAAFALLLSRWERPIRRLCIRMTGNEHRSEDLTQEAFARVFSKRHQFRQGSRFSTWLWRIALNLCFEDGRRTARRGEQLFDPIAAGGGELAADEAGPAERAADREQAEIVRTALGRLGELHRSMVVLREYEGLTYREIAEVLEIPEGTVKWRFAEALTQLSELLEPLAPERVDEARKLRMDSNKTAKERGQSPAVLLEPIDNAEAITMNHPSHEELVDFLDGEISTSRAADVAQHVAECGECGELVAAWRGVRKQLPAWTLTDRGSAPLARRRDQGWQTLGRIAAALVLLASGFILARMTAKAPDADQLRAELAGQIGDQLRGEMGAELSKFAAVQSFSQQAYQQAVIDSVEQLDARWLAEFGELRKDIETVAVRTQAEFARLANMAP